jgi:head-tail adaptor
MKLVSKLRKLWAMIKPLSEKEYIERYLSEAQDLADLERRLKKVYQTGL